MSALIKLLDRPIAYQPAFAQLKAGKVRSGPTAAVLLSQLVYWHNRMNGEWMYKTREDIKKETGLSRDEQETARKRLVALGVMEEELRGVPATLHYRINSERLEQLLLAPDRAESQLVATPPTRRRESRQQDGGNPANKMAVTPPTSGGESRQQAGGDPAIFLTGDYTESTQEITQEITQRAGEKNSVNNFSKIEPCPDDENLARWFWARILELHERAAEYDGMLARPEEPDWPSWTNEIRLLREEGVTHAQMREMVNRIHRDAFWCSRILDTAKLHEHWASLTLKLCSGNLANGGDPFGFSSKCDKAIPPGFRG